ncbi:MAG: copper chaperone PCu(A)C [Cellvibrionaceae bacterium]
MISRKLVLALCLSVLFPLLALPAFASGVKINSIQINEPLPGQQVSAGYLWLCNFSDKEWVLVGVSSSQVDRVEIHDHLHENGVMKMRQLDQLVIGAGEHKQFKSHGLHLMVFGLQLGLEKMELVFEFKNGERVVAQAEVRSLK